MTGLYNTLMKKARYICLEGTEGVGKTTQTKKLVESLKARGYRVLQTKEPGIDLVPLTMILRGIMLDNQYDAVLTKPAREFISQAIRSIHLERLIVPSLSEYDFIIQDRGILSGYAYGEACGNSFANLYLMATQNIDSADDGKDVLPLKPEYIYDQVIYLRGDSIKGLEKAKASKQEFETGDAMESRGNSFMDKVSKNMDEMSSRFKTVRIDVDGKSIEEVHNEILTCLEIKDV
jgi:dTMP kinase